MSKFKGYIDNSNQNLLLDKEQWSIWGAETYATNYVSLQFDTNENKLILDIHNLTGRYLELLQQDRLWIGISRRHSGHQITRMQNQHGVGLPTTWTKRGWGRAGNSCKRVPSSLQVSYTLKELRHMIPAELKRTLAYDGSYNDFYFDFRPVLFFYLQRSDRCLPTNTGRYRLWFNWRGPRSAYSFKKLETI